MSRMATEERVLCFERKLFEELGVFQGLSLAIEKYLPVVTCSANVLYMNRSDAEQDRRYKQLIPYVLIICHGRILRYRRGRGGQETRLHGLYSVGIGGHISEEDHGLFSSGLGYQEGMRRELMEERSEEHTSELQSRLHLVCRLLLEKKKNCNSAEADAAWAEWGGCDAWGGNGGIRRIGTYPRQTYGATVGQHTGGERTDTVL